MQRKRKIRGDTTGVGQDTENYGRYTVTVL